MKARMLAWTLTAAALLGATLTAVPAGWATPIDPVTLPGTGDSQDILRTLAKDYTARYPGRVVNVPNSIGSDGGIRVVGTAESPIGRVARLPNAEEIARYGELTYAEFARVPVVFVVTPRAGVRNLSAQQICDVFSGRVTNWKDVGGQDFPVEVQGRPNGSNLQIIREKLGCFAKLEITPRAHFNLSNSDLVASMKTFPGAVGFMPLSEATLHSYQVVTIDHIAPTAPGYPLAISLGFVHKDELSGEIQAFLEYLGTEPAREILRKTGHVPAAR